MLTGPRKRTLALAALIAAGLVGVTANSSEAAPRRKSVQKKNHSTSVKKKSQSKQLTNAKRLAEMRTHSAAPERADAIRRILEARSMAQEAPLVDKQGVPVADTPRAAVNAGNTRASSPLTPASPADSAVREALARRREWTEPRQSVL